MTKCWGWANVIIQEISRKVSCDHSTRGILAWTKQNICTCLCKLTPEGPKFLMCSQNNAKVRGSQRPLFISKYPLMHFLCFYFLPVCLEKLWANFEVDYRRFSFSILKRGRYTTKQKYWANPTEGLLSLSPIAWLCAMCIEGQKSIVVIIIILK